MSIEDEDGNEIMRVGNFHAIAFKIAIWFAPIFAIWLVSKVLTHDTEIAVIKMQLSMQSGHGMNQNVNAEK